MIKSPMFELPLHSAFRMTGHRAQLYEPINHNGL